MSWFQGRPHRGKASLGLQTPLARTDELVVEHVGEEVLVYDRRNDQAHCLSSDAAMIWRVCDGSTSPAEIATALELDREAVAAAIEELDSCGLLDSAPIAGVTRREATLRMAKVGGVAAAAPLIYSIMAPTPALAASQAFCLSVTGCFENGSGCSTCFKAGCVCCGAGSSGNAGAKLCTADCTCTFCNACIIHCHCTGVSGNNSTCTAGPTGLGNGECTVGTCPPCGF